MSRITGVAPPPPINPPLGTIWRPEDVGPQDGPLAAELGRLAAGLIRVRNTCRRCAVEFDGWMFAAIYRRKEAQLEEPYYVGLCRACPGCTADDEKRGEIASLQPKIEQTRQRWESARTLKDKIPAGRLLARHLNQLLILLRIGTDRFAAASDQLDAVNDWLSEHRPTEV